MKLIEKTDCKIKYNLKIKGGMAKLTSHLIEVYIKKRRESFNEIIFFK